MKAKITSAIARVVFLLPVLLVLAAIFIPLVSGNDTTPSKMSVKDTAETVVYSPSEQPIKAPPQTSALNESEISIGLEGWIYTDRIPMSYGWQYYTQEMCVKYDVPYLLMLGLFETESQFDFDADSGWAYGIGQIGYINFDWLKEQGMDPETKQGNIEASTYMLGDLLKKYGDPHLALMAYNCGESGAAELWAEGCESSQYSRTVMSSAEKWSNYIYEFMPEEVAG